MSGGSIYIDPDSVSHVSSQIGMTAEQLDSLRQTIVPRVNEVISMSYPSIQEMPNVAYPLNSSQDNIEAFNYRTQILVEDLRITSIKLNQIAEAGRTMNEILLRQTTMFGSGGISNNPSGSGTNSGLTWKTTVNDANTFLGIVNSLIHFLNRSGVLKDAKFISYIDDFLKNYKSDFILAVLGTIADILTGKEHDPKTIVSDIVGGVFGFGSGAIDGADEVLLVLAVMQFTSSISGGIQGFIANQYPKGSTLNLALEKTSRELTETADNDNVGQTLDNMGRLVVDIRMAEDQSEINALNTNGGSVSVVTWQTFGTDAQNLGHDLSNIAISIPQFGVNTSAMSLEDDGLILNLFIQNSPLPSSWKSASQSMITTGIKYVSDTAAKITHNRALLENIDLAALLLVS